MHILIGLLSWAFTSIGLSLRNFFYYFKFRLCDLLVSLHALCYFIDGGRQLFNLFIAVNTGLLAFSFARLKTQEICLYKCVINFTFVINYSTLAGSNNRTVIEWLLNSVEHSLIAMEGPRGSETRDWDLNPKERKKKTTVLMSLWKIEKVWVTGFNRLTGIRMDEVVI